MQDKTPKFEGGQPAGTASQKPGTECEEGSSPNNTKASYPKLNHISPAPTVFVQSTRTWSTGDMLLSSPERSNIEACPPDLGMFRQ